MMRVAFALALLTGCGASAQTVARHTLATTATALREADEALAPRYAAAAVEALEASSSAQEYARAMRPWDAAEDAERAALSSLLASEALVDAWERNGASWLAAAPCLALAAVRLVDALRAVGVASGPVDDAAAVLRGLGGSCNDTR